MVVGAATDLAVVAQVDRCGLGDGGLLGVDAGDLIAMKLTNQTTGAFYWAGRMKS